MPTLHLATSDRAVSMVEYFPVPVWDDVEEAPHFDGLAVPEGGEVSISDAPGLGATLYCAAVAAATPLPVLIQDFNPGGPTMGAALVTEILDRCGNLRFVKLEDPMMVDQVERLAAEGFDQPW